MKEVDLAGLGVEVVVDGRNCLGGDKRLLHIKDLLRCGISIGGKTA